MKEFTYENQGTHTYLVYAIKEDDTIDSMSLGMLTNNNIAGLAHAMFTQMDATRYIKYDVSAKISVKQFFSGQVNKKRILGVFNGIVDAMLSAEDYMIDINSILLDLDYIFADVTTCETVLVCLPIENEEADGVDLGTFFKHIMFSTQFDPTENCDHVAKIINYLNSSPVFSLVDFKKVLDAVAHEAVSQTSVQQKQQPVVQKQAVTPNPIQNLHTQNGSAPILQTEVQAQRHEQASIQTPISNQQKIEISAAQQPAVSQQPVTAPEKKISMFNLLMHYSAENKALYKAQKVMKANEQAAQEQTKPKTKPASKVKMEKAEQAGFAIPGQTPPTVTPGFTIPNQTVQTMQNSVPKPQQAMVQQPQVQQQQSIVTPPYVPRSISEGQPMNFGETTVLGGGGIGETTVLLASQNPNKIIAPHLIRKKNNEKISLNKPVFRIGKERSYVDYFIGDNTAISRSHANFITREGEYVVVDTNSTNHTFVNGTMIQSNVETIIKHGDIIRLGNEDFDFKLY